MTGTTFATQYDPREKSVSHTMVYLFIWYAKKHPTERSLDITSLNRSELRTVEIMLQCYGASGDDLTSLQSIAWKHGVTKQYISRIALDVLERIKADALPGNLLDHIRTAVENYMPTTADKLEAKMRERLGPSLSIQAGERFAREVVGSSIVDLTALRDAEKAYESVAATIRDVILTIVRSVGAAQVHFVAGLMSERLGRWVTASEVVEYGKSRYGFEWLDEHDGWFWYGRATDSVAARCALKILYSAERGVDIHEIVAGIHRRNQANIQTLKGQYTILPPLSVLSEIVARLPFVESTPNMKFHMASGEKVVTGNQNLSRTEAKILETIRKHDGAVSRYALNEELVNTGIIKQKVFDAALQYSPIFKPIAHGFWTVIGGRVVQRPREVGDGGPFARCDSYVHPAKVIPPPDFDEEGWHKLYLNVPKTAFLHNKWVIPRRLRVLLSSGAYDLIGHHDPVFYKGPELGTPAFHRLIGKLGPPGRTTSMRVEFRIHPEKRRIAFIVLD